MKTLREYFEQEAATYNRPRLGDDFAINAREECLLETYVCDEREDGIVLHADDRMMSLLEGYGWLESEETDECDYDIDSEESENDVIEPADRGEYDDEAGMAKDDLYTIVRAARRLNGMLDDDENMPEWVQSKINKAADYVDTAADYIESKKDQGVAEAAGQYRVILTLKDDSAGPGESATQRVNVSVSAADEQSAIAQAKQKLIKSPRYSGSRIVGAKIQQGVAEGTSQNLSVQQLATISDEALDNAYHYGRSNPGNTFGWQANLMSAAYAKKMIDAGVTDIEKIADAIHKGWNVTAQKFVQNPDQFDDTEKLRQAGKLEAKLAQRAKLMKINYAQLDNDEQEKDRVVARALLQAIRGDQGVAEGDYDIRRDPTYQKYNPETHTMMYKDGKHKAVEHDQVAKARALGWKARSSLKAFAKGQGGVAEAEMDEAKYQGREVPLGKPMKGDVKKSKVYVRGPKGNVVKVNFGDPNMKIKKSNPKRRKSFRARHNCSNPGPRWKARYWSCRAW